MYTDISVPVSVVSHSAFLQVLIILFCGTNPFHAVLKLCRTIHNSVTYCGFLRKFQYSIRLSIRIFICIIVFMTDNDKKNINLYISRIAHGDHDALDSLARLVSGRMLSVAYAIVKNRALAEEVVQDSFVRILRKAGLFRTGTNGYAWICKIVQNVALNTLKRENRFSQYNIEDFCDISSCFDIAQVTSDNIVLKDALSSLLPLERRLIYEKYFMDYSVRESAKSVGKSKSAVQRMIVQAEEKMKNRLNDSADNNFKGCRP